MRTTLCLACGVLVLATMGAAQTPMKLVGRMQCAKPDPNYAVPVSDGANHAMSLSAVKCTWSDGAIAGDRLKDEEDTFVSDATGNTSRDRGYGVGSLVNGDKYFVRFAGTTTLKDNAPVGATCTWRFTGGTGKLKGITGKGMCKGTFKTDGTAAWDINGEYQLAVPGKSE